MERPGRSSRLFCLLFLMLLAVPTFGCTAAQVSLSSTATAPEVDKPLQEYVQEHGYPSNDSGQTYGPLMPEDFYDQSGEYNREEMPDLLLVMSDEGFAGYVYWNEMLGEEPHSIDEALKSSSGGPRELPVYTEDGSTVIGTFTLR